MGRRGRAAARFPRTEEQAGSGRVAGLEPGWLPDAILMLDLQETGRQVQLCWNGRSCFPVISLLFPFFGEFSNGSDEMLSVCLRAPQSSQ